MNKIDGKLTLLDAWFNWYNTCYLIVGLI